MIIGLIGFAGAGKTSAGQIICDNFVDFSRHTFSDSVKDAVAAIFAWDRELLEGESPESRVFRENKDEYWSGKLGRDITPRVMLQLMGTEMGRDKIHPDIWIHSLEARMNKSSKKNFVITDVRFPNEIAFIRSKNGFIVRVVRGNDPDWYVDALEATKALTVLFPENLASSKGWYRMTNEHKVHYSEWAWIGQNVDYVLDNNGDKDALGANIKIMLQTFAGPDIIV